MDTTAPKKKAELFDKREGTVLGVPYTLYAYGLLSVGKRPNRKKVRIQAGADVEAKAREVAEPTATVMAADARGQAKAEGLTLLRSESNVTGFQGVTIFSCSKLKPYQAQVQRGGKTVYLGCFATVEEAGLAYARSPEGRAAVAAAAAAQAPPRAARARGQTAPPSVRAPAAPKPESPPPQKLDALKQEVPPAWPDGAVEVKTEVKVEPSLKQEPPTMPDGTVVKEETWPVEGPANLQVAAGSSAAVAARKRPRLGSA